MPTIKPILDFKNAVMAIEPKLSTYPTENDVGMLIWYLINEQERVYGPRGINESDTEFNMRFNDDATDDMLDTAVTNWRYYIASLGYREYAHNKLEYPIFIKTLETANLRKIVNDLYRNLPLLWLNK